MSRPLLKVDRTVAETHHGDSVTRNWPTSPSWREVLEVARNEFRPIRKLVVLIGAIGSFVAITELAVVFLIAALASALVGGKQSELAGLDVLSPRGLAGWAIAAVVARGVLEWVQVVLQVRATRDFDVYSRHELLGAYIRADWSLQADKDPGEVGAAYTTYLVNDRSAFAQWIQVPIQCVSFIIMFVGSLIAGGVWAIGIVLLSIALAIVFRPLTTQAHRAGHALRVEGRALDSFIYDIPHTRLDSRVYGVDERFVERMDRISRRSAKVVAGSQGVKLRLSSLYTSAVYLLAVLGLALLVVLDVSGPARYAAVILLLYRGLGYARALQSSYQSIVSAIPTILELQHQRNLLNGSEDRRDGIRLPGDIECMTLRDATYLYPNGHRALRGATITLKRGEAVGIVGPSGAGKSTLAQLILGLRNPTSGTVTVDGVDLLGVDLSTWFGRIAMVSQSPRAIHDTVANNVRFLRSGISDNEVTSALKTARLYDDVLALPEGLDTVVGEFGVRLSGGQVQRLAVARALVGNPDLVVLDEPTSALDPITEDALRVGFEYLKQRCVLVIIAHRFSTLRLCDQIVVVDDGQIQAIGDRSMIESENEFFAEAVRLARLA